MSQPTDHREINPRLGRAWREDRRHVLDIALRMLGDIGDAEDVVQEAYARLLRTDVDALDDVRGWLVTVVSRLCLDQLRSARRRRQRPLDPERPDRPAPADGGVTPRAAVDPADRITLDDSVRLALHVVLERLSPAERTAFVLHDVFQLSFDDVAEVVGRSPAACRQLASRARRHVADDAGPGRFAVETAEQRQLTETFIRASATGDLDALLSVLDPEVAGQADLGGVIGLLPPVTGRDEVAANLLRFLGPDAGVTLLSLPIGEEPCVAAIRDRRVVVMVTLTVRDGVGHPLHAVVDRAKLARVDAALQP